MIRSITLGGFQSIEALTTIKLVDLTLLYGPNSAGKSSLIDVLAHLKKIFNYENLKNSIKINKTKDDMFIGISYEFKFNLEGNNRYDNAFNYRNSFGDSGPLYDFCEALTGRVIFILFRFGDADMDCDIDISADGEQILSVKFDISEFDCYLNNVEPTGASDNFVSGIVTLRKSSPFSFLSDLKAKRGSSLQQWFIHNNDQELTIRGLRFFHSKSDSIQYDALRLCVSTDNLLDQTNATSFIDMFSGLEGSDLVEHKEWFDNEFREDNRNEIESKLREIARDLSVGIDVLFAQGVEAISHSHVSGTRTLLNSTKAYHLNNYSYKIEDKDGDFHVRTYLNWEHQNWWIKQTFNEERNAHDFVTGPLIAKLMPSLGSHRLYIDKYRISADVEYRQQSMRDRVQDCEDQYGSEDTIAFLRILKGDNSTLGFEDVGSGYSYIVPILCALTTSSMSIIEQPELHLHPRAQCELADVFINAVNCNLRPELKHRVLIESHSEHLILRISRRIRETSRAQLHMPALDLSPSQVLIYYFQPQGNGTSKIHEIRFGADGDFLDLWPDGFFAERDKELFDE